MPQGEATTVEKEAGSQDANPSGDPFEGARLPGNEDPSGTPEKAEAEAESQPETEAESSVEDGAETPAAEGEGKKAEEAAPPKLWAERYKTPEELEIAYKHSSHEGKRLSVALKEQVAEHEKTVAQLQDEIETLKIQAEAGPEIKEPTDEELEALGPIKATRLLQRISDRKAKMESLKARKEAREQDAKKQAAGLVEHIKQKSSKMMADSKNWPDYSTLQADMDEIMDAEPGITGLPATPELLYFAAYGRRALKRDSEAKTKTSESKEAAKAKAKAAAVGAGAAGSAGAAKPPLSEKKDMDPDSDEACNERLIKAGNKRSGSLF